MKILLTISGTEAVKAKLEDRVGNFDIQEWFDTHDPILTKRANIARDKALKNRNPDNQYNPFEGDLSARQLGETVDEFLLRLPPATTVISNELHWVWIANTFAPTPQNEVEKVRVLSDDPPTTNRRDLSRLITGGQTLLQELSEEKERIANEKKGTAGIVRATNKARDAILVKIHDLAQTMNITSGKVCQTSHILLFYFLNIFIIEC